MTQSTPEKPIKEQQFFEDPAVDRLMGTLMALATEVYVLRSRVYALETRIIEAGVTDFESLHKGVEDDAIGSMKLDARQFAESLLKPLLGIQDAVGLPED